MLRRKLPPGSWCVALGTIMAVVSIFDGVWGLTTAAVGVELQAIAAEVESNRLGITIGSIVRGVTFGVFSLRGVETAQHAGELLAMLPRPDYLVEVGWIRFGFSIVAFVSGVLLTWRLRFAVWTSLVWAIASVCWTTWATIRTWSVMTDGVNGPWQGDSLPYLVLETTMHFAWPLVLGVWLVTALARRPHGR